MNKYKEHVYVIPEDDANRQIANGFVGYHGLNDARIRVMPVAGGWNPVLETFKNEYVDKLKGNLLAHVVMLIDFDDQFDSRKKIFENAIPDDIKSRVFVVRSKDTPERLKTALKISFEKIGESLAEDCAAETMGLWDHNQLIHNNPDRLRLVQIVKSFLF